MKVLLVSPYHPELVRGGAQQACFELFKALNAEGDTEAVLLAGATGANAAVYKRDAQIIEFDGRDREYLFLTRDYDIQWNKLSDFALVEAFAEFIRSVQPDVVHFHHFISFGIDLLTLTRRVLPRTRLVFTFHEFRAICEADGQFVRKLDRTVCSRASPARCNQCFPDLQPEFFFTRNLWFKKHLSVVDVFTVPSRFMIKRFVEWGLDRTKIEYIPNGLPDYSIGTPPSPERQKRNRFGFFGQFGDNKGVDVLLQAVDILRSDKFTDFAVEINGDNLQFASEPYRQAIEMFWAREKARIVDGIVCFNGPYSVEDLPARMARIDWCVVPSRWPETFGLVVSEAWMFKRPVIVSRIGAFEERVADGRDGLHFTSGDALSLAATLRRASGDMALWNQLVNGIKPRANAIDSAQAMKGLYGRYLGIANPRTTGANRVGFLPAILDRQR